MKVLNEHRIETLCCVIVLIAFVGAFFKPAMVEIWAVVKSNEELTTEIRTKDRMITELKNRLEAEKMACQTQQEQIGVLTNQLDVERTLNKSLKAEMKENQRAIQRAQQPVAVEDSETAYQIWSLNREIRRQAAISKWR